MNELTKITIPDYAPELANDPQLRSPYTRKQYAHQLEKFARWRGERPVSLLLVEEYLAELQNHRRPATVKQAAAAIRWLARRGIKAAYDRLPIDEARDMETRLSRIANIPDPKMDDPDPAGRHLSTEEINAMLAAANDGTPAGLRAVAFIAVAAGTGARNIEIRKLRVEDVTFIDPETAQIKITHGKGETRRTVELFPPLCEYLGEWIERRGVRSGYLFTRFYKGGEISEDAPLSYQATTSIIKWVWRQAKVKKMTWHDFRRTMVGRLLDENEDPSTIMNITGHKDFKTVKRYDHRPADRRQSALRKMQTDLHG